MHGHILKIIRTCKQRLAWILLFSSTAAAGLVCVGLWIAGRSAPYLIHYGGRSGDWSSFDGNLIFWQLDFPDYIWDELASEDAEMIRRWPKLGAANLRLTLQEFRLEGELNGPLGINVVQVRFIGRMITIPWWILVSISAVPMIIGVFVGTRRWIRSRARVRQGLCGQCGYDLRGCIENRCPECGTGFDAHGRSQSSPGSKNGLNQ